jgi:hypothetical protein
MKKSLTATESTQRRKVLGLVVSALGGALVWRRFFRSTRQVRPDQTRARAQNVAVTLNPLAVPRRTATTQDNG